MPTNKPLTTVLNREPFCATQKPEYHHARPDTSTTYASWAKASGKRFMLRSSEPFLLRN